jgi:hypothetical protein
MMSSIMPELVEISAYVGNNSKLITNQRTLFPDPAAKTWVCGMQSDRG